MDINDKTFQEFRAYSQLLEEMIADATKDDLAEVARILAMQAAHYARKYGETPLPDLNHLLTNSLRDEASVGLMRNGTEALVGVLAMVTGATGVDMDEPLQWKVFQSFDCSNLFTSSGSFPTAALHWW